MAGLIKPIVATAVAGTGLLGADESEAGFLTKGVRGARDKIDYNPAARGNTTLKLGLANAPDGTGMSTNDRLDVLIGAMDGMDDHQKFKTFQTFMHQKTNYDSWNKEARRADGGELSGPAYKDGLDAFLEDIIERRPSLAGVAQRYAMGRGGRLTRSGEDVERSMQRARNNGDRNGNRGSGRGQRGAADTGLLAATAAGTGAAAAAPGLLQGGVFQHTASETPIVERKEPVRNQSALLADITDFGDEVFKSVRHAAGPLADVLMPFEGVNDYLKTVNDYDKQPTWWDRLGLLDL